MPFEPSSKDNALPAKAGTPYLAFQDNIRPVLTRNETPSRDSTALKVMPIGNSRDQIPLPPSARDERGRASACRELRTLNF
jgi:hypothetical protein